MKHALLVTSFGSAHRDTLEKSIFKTEKAISSLCPDLPFYRAFTSPTIRRKLLAEQNFSVDSVEEALERIAADGFTHVILQPTLLIPGQEYCRLQQTIDRYAGNLTITVGQPLLQTRAEEEAMVSLLSRLYPVPADTVLVWMGHGTDHPANSVYGRMAEDMRRVQGLTMRLCTVEGTPDFQDLAEELSTLSLRKAMLAPMMLVAGDHAKNDMAGPEPDSLRSLLEQTGFSVTCRIIGLGEHPEIHRMFAEKFQTLLP